MSSNDGRHKFEGLPEEADTQYVALSFVAAANGAAACASVLPVSSRLRFSKIATSLNYHVLDWKTAEARLAEQAKHGRGSKWQDRLMKESRAAAAASSDGAGAGAGAGDAGLVDGVESDDEDEGNYRLSFKKEVASKSALADDGAGMCCCCDGSFACRQGSRAHVRRSCRHVWCGAWQELVASRWMCTCGMCVPTERLLYDRRRV